MENSESKDLEQNAQTEEAPAEAEAVDEQPADDKLAAELAQVKDQLLRTMAEYDNHRKRTAKAGASRGHHLKRCFRLPAGHGQSRKSAPGGLH